MLKHGQLDLWNHRHGLLYRFEIDFGEFDYNHKSQLSLWIACCDSEHQRQHIFEVEHFGGDFASIRIYDDELSPYRNKHGTQDSTCLDVIYTRIPSSARKNRS